MKKLFFGLTLLLIIIFGSIYGFLFTTAGNTIVASIIEKKVNEGQQDVNLIVNDFKLTTDSIYFKATLDENSTILVDGALNIFAKSVDLNYNINVKDLSKFQNITKQKLNGSLSTKGTIVGDQKLTTINGDSLIASSKTIYKLILKEFKPNNIFLNMKDAKIEELLYMVNQPIYAEGLLSINATINDANIATLDGLVNTSIKNGVLNAKTLNKELKTEDKSIKFNLDTLTNLIPNNANTKLDFDSTIAKLNVKDANVNLKTMVLNSDFDLFVKNLSKLELLINQKFNGSFSTTGNVIIDKKDVALNGTSNIFGSDTTYDIHVKDAKAKAINILVSDAKVESILNMVNQPSYASGILDIVAKVKDADLNNLDGVVTAKVREGLVNNSVVNKAFEQKLKDRLDFDADISTTLSGTKALSIVDVNTSMALLDMKEALYDLSTSTFTSDYALDVEDLSKLYDVTQTKMRGKAKVFGNIKQDPTNLSVDGRTSLFNGDITFSLLNDEFKSKIDGVEIKSLTHMLYYPEIFSSTSNIDIDYNLATKKGNIIGTLLDGQFVENKFSSIINSFAKFDLTKEIYEQTDIKSNINDNIINSVVNLKSKNTTIDVTRSTLDTKKKTVNALIKTAIKDYSFDTTVTGNLSSPKVKVDTSKFIKQKATKKLKEKIQEKLGDKLNLDKLFNDNSDLIKNEQKTAQKIHTDQEIVEAFKRVFGQN